MLIFILLFVFQKNSTGEDKVRRIGPKDEEIISGRGEGLGEVYKVTEQVSEEG